MKIEGVFRIEVFIHGYSGWCCSSTLGGVMLEQKRKMGLLAIDIKRMKAGPVTIKWIVRTG